MVTFLLLMIIALMAFILYRRLLPAIIVIPLSAIAIAIIGGADSNQLLTDVIEQGATSLSSVLIIVTFGAILTAYLKETGTVQMLLRIVAELSGENRFSLTVSMLLLMAVLFTTLSGLGSVIIVAAIVLPILASAGIKPMDSGAIFLIGLSLGGTLNPVNWGTYTGILHLSNTQIMPFATTVFILTLTTGVIYIAKQHRPAPSELPIVISTSLVLILLAVVTLIFLNRPSSAYYLRTGVSFFLLSLMAIGTVMALGRTLHRAVGRIRMNRANLLVAFGLLYPLLLILLSNLSKRSFIALKGVSIDVPISAALLAGIAFVFFASYSHDGRNVNLLTRSVIEGTREAVPALILIIGIGMLLKAAQLPEVSKSFQPILASIIPENGLLFILTFALLSPLALYRGPLNLWGMGSGIIGILLGTGRMSPQLIMSTFFSSGMIQGVCDPTNTHNVWIANYLRLEVFDLTKRTFFWIYPITIIGLSLGRLLYR